MQGLWERFRIHYLKDPHQLIALHPHAPIITSCTSSSLVADYRQLRPLAPRLKLLPLPIALIEYLLR
mgnify:CR=1